jgi:hypothetical protein
MAAITEEHYSLDAHPANGARARTLVSSNILTSLEIRPLIFHFTIEFRRDFDLSRIIRQYFDGLRVIPHSWPFGEGSSRRFEEPAGDEDLFEPGLRKVGGHFALDRRSRAASSK